ncbi:MAG: hypothetical protein Q3976_00305 [Corynebacterium sp.]|nr:hypothetical protein [Corynebacterium sp.]
MNQQVTIALIIIYSQLTDGNRSTDNLSIPITILAPAPHKAVVAQCFARGMTPTIFTYSRDKVWLNAQMLVFSKTSG